MQIAISFVIRHSVKERCEWRHTVKKKVCDGVYSSLMSNATLITGTFGSSYGKSLKGRLKKFGNHFRIKAECDWGPAGK